MAPRTRHDSHRSSQLGQRLAAGLALGGCMLGCDGHLDPVRGPKLDPQDLALGDPVEPAEVPASDVVITVRSDGNLVAISPLIYGINGSWDFATQHHTLVRRAGQRYSTYNWENNASNAGADYYYQNDATLSDSDESGAAVLPTLQAAEVQSRAALLSVAMLDNVAADKLGDGDVRDSGADWLAARFSTNQPANPNGATTTPDLTDDIVYQDDFVRWVREGFEGTDVLFTLDSTPDLWTRFHLPLHPQPVGYGELVDRTIRWGAAVKAVWPGVPVVGLASYGWSGWEMLTDTATGEQPADAEGNGPFLDYWLEALRAEEALRGVRLVDYVDLHWHPEATGGGVRVLVNDDDSPEVVAARLQAPRSLWDPTYVEESWITEVATNGQPIRWLGRTLERIAAHYPGTKLAVGEWSYGGANHVSGALATADALGAWGRYGVGLAAHSGSPGPYPLAAFAAFRNFDGQGATFGDTALVAVTTDAERTSTYASLDWSDQSRVVVIVINKAEQTIVAGLRLAHPQRFVRASTWVLDASAPELRPGSEITVVGQNAFRWDLPPRSLTVVVPTTDP